MFDASIRKQADYVPLVDGPAEIGLAVDELNVSEAPHERLHWGLEAERENSQVVEEYIVQQQRFFEIHWTVVVQIGRIDDDGAVQSELLGDMPALVWVVPEHPGVGKVDLRLIRFTDSNGRLGLTGNTVELVVHPHAVPSKGRGEVDVIRELDNDRGVLRHPYRRPWGLSVEPIDLDRLAFDFTAQQSRFEAECVPVGQLDHSTHRRFGKRADVHTRSGKKWRDIGKYPHEGRHQHLHVGTGRRHAPNRDVPRPDRIGYLLTCRRGGPQDESHDEYDEPHSPSGRLRVVAKCTSTVVYPVKPYDAQFSVSNGPCPADVCIAPASGHATEYDRAGPAWGRWEESSLFRATRRQETCSSEPAPGEHRRPSTPTLSIRSN